MSADKIKFAHLLPKKENISTAEAFVSKAALRTENIYSPTDKRDQAFLLKLSRYEMAQIEEGFKKSRCRSRQEYVRSFIFKKNEEEN